MSTANSIENDRHVSKPRLVAALLAELDAAGAMVLAECGQSSAVFQGNLHCDFKIPFENSEIGFDAGSADPNLLKCVCCYGGQRISFELRRVDKNRFGLPKQVTLGDLRHEARLAFAERMYSAEVVSKSGAVYGYAADINRDYLAVDLDAKHRLAEGEAVKVLVRLVNTNCDVFFNSCSVAQVKDSLVGSRVILRFERRGTGKVEQRRHERRLVESTSISVAGSPFVDGGKDLSLGIQNISSGGMTVGLRKGLNHSQLMAGLIFKTQVPDLAFIIVWTKGDSMGIRPLVADPNHLARWIEYVDRMAPPDDRSAAVTRRELADLLTHSGLLKGERRLPLGKSAHAHLIASGAGESPLLIQRCILSDSDGKPGLHVSSKRISESTWFFGEGAALTEKFGDYNAMLDACTSRMAWMSKQSSLLCRYLTGIWHYTVKSTASWGELIAKHENSQLLDSLQMSVAAVGQLPNPLGNVTVEEMFRLSAAERRKTSLDFSPDIFEALVGGDGTHPMLNAELGKFGPYHRVATKVVKVEDGIRLIAHRIFTHNVWSSTGVTNSVFVLVPVGVHPEGLCRGLKALVDDDISYGSDDFLVIFDGQLGACEQFADVLPKTKRFSFLVHDLLLNDSLAFKDSDEEKARRG